MSDLTQHRVEGDLLALLDALDVAVDAYAEAVRAEAEHDSEARRRYLTAFLGGQGQPGPQREARARYAALDATTAAGQAAAAVKVQRARIDALTLRIEAMRSVNANLRRVV